MKMFLKKGLTLNTSRKVMKALLLFLKHHATIWETHSNTLCIRSQYFRINKKRLDHKRPQIFKKTF